MKVLIFTKLQEVVQVLKKASYLAVSIVFVPVLVGAAIIREITSNINS